MRTYIASGTYTKEELASFTFKSDRMRYAKQQASAENYKRPATQENSSAKRIDELNSLSLIPFEALNKEQQYANPGDTLPIIFCRRENDEGGVWVSPPLIDSSSDNFVPSFLYLISHGLMVYPATTTQELFLGGQCLEDTGVSGGITIQNYYSGSAAICPVASFAITCDHTNFNFLADPLSVTVGEQIHIRTVNNYATGVTIRAKALYPTGVSSPTALETYTLTVYRTDNSTGTTVTVGTFSTNSTSGITSISDTMSAGNYTYTVENTAVLAAATDKPESILLEFRQANTFPTSYDRTSSYANMTVLGITGNLYDIKKPYSEPSALKQLHLFAEDGISVQKWRYSLGTVGSPLSLGGGSSNNFADFVYYWFKNSGKFPNQNFDYFPSSAPALCALFYDQYNITYNVYLTNSTSFLSYVQGVAPFMLCSFYTYFGIYNMKPLLPITSTGLIDSGALTPVESFDDLEPNPDSVRTNIIAGSYSKQYKNTTELLPIQVVVTWRGQNKNNLETTQTTTVRYSDYAANVPEEIYDMSEFCTNADHATIFAKYILATRRYSLHTVTFQTARNITTPFALEPLDLIQVSLTRTNSEGDSRTETEHYLVDAIDYDQVGIVTITATHFPLDGSDASIISNSVLSGSFEVTT